jgi:tRNA-uridine 2-sulfurtransferase
MKTEGEREAPLGTAPFVAPRGNVGSDEKGAVPGGRVLMAMSGGVDSSVAAALLLEQGYDVIGVTMQVWPESEDAPPGLRACCSMSAIEDARRVAGALGIRHYVLNFRDEFRDRVITPFIETYLAGRTPNPCILCNRDLKFDTLLQRAEELECNWVATGHYVRLRHELGRWQLLTGLDPTKDQSYVLYCLTQEQLARALFPLGEMTKMVVRERALKLRLPVAHKPDSQEICFIPDNDQAAFMERSAPEELKPGPIVDEEGTLIGHHRGIACYTLGQRKGLGIASSERLYVARIDAEHNTLVVGPEASLYHTRLTIGFLNYVGISSLQESLRLTGKLRYGMTPQPCSVELCGEDGAHVVFNSPQRAPTPGQAAVFYDGERVALGGVVEAVE